MTAVGIYGVNGFIGRHLLRRLVSAGYAVRAVSRSIDPSLRKTYGEAVEFVEADLNDSNATSASLAKLDVAIQLISSSSPAQGNHQIIADLKAGVLPHVRFLSEVVGANIKKFIFASSGGTVYGPAATLPISEACLPKPVSSYGMTKLIVENYIQMSGRIDGLNYTILRIGNPFGPGQTLKRGQGLIPAVLHLHRANKPVTIIGDGEARRDYLFVDDLIDAFECVLNEPNSYQQIFNVGSGKSRSTNDVIKSIETILGRTLSKTHLSDRNTDVDDSALDVTKIKQILNWEPKTAFHEGLELTIKHFFESDVHLNNATA